MKRFVLFLVGAVLVTLPVAPRLRAQPPANASAIAQAVANGRASANEVLIQFRPGASALDQQDARGLVNAVRRQLLRGGPDGDLELAVIPPGLALADAITLLNQHAAVAFAEPNWIYQHQATSNDPYFLDGSLWGMYGPATTPSNQYGSRAADAWADGKTGSNTVFVGVIDEGIDFNHEDLSANIWTNNFDPVDGIDNDGNGYVDDVHGWDFVNNDNSIYDGSARRLSIDAHGTHVSGTIGGMGGNGKGVAGVNWNVRVISAKFLGTNGGTTADAVKAVDYITDLKQLHNLNIVATNNSWGGGGYSQALHDAIIRGAKADILFIAAAGNSTSNNDATASYPSNYNTTIGTSTEAAASYDGVIAVAALCGSSVSSYCTGGGGTLASFSSYGATTVDLAAPGVGVYSSTPKNGYSSYSGTSMATPHVTGAAALYASVFAGSSAATIKTAILGSVTSTPALAGKTVTGGRLNICGLLALAGCASSTTPPLAPTLTLTGVSGANVSLSWTVAADATSYTVLRSTLSGGPYATVASVTTTSYTDTVPATDTYYYVVQAVNAGGASENSNEIVASVTVPAPPAPSGLAVTVPPAKKQLALSWTGSAGATSYKVYRCNVGCGTEASPILGNFSVIGSATTTSVVNTGLKSGTKYYYCVSAVGGGESACSNIASGTPR